MLPSIITNLFRSRANSPALIPEQMPEISAALPIWGDDAELRALAQDSRDGITNWVVAGDLRELFGKITAYNQARPESEHIRVEVMSDVSEKIAEWRGKNLHNPEKNGVNERKGPLVVKGEMILKMFGPSAMGGLRLRVGEQMAAMTYVHNWVETYIDVEKPQGDTKRIYFEGAYAEDLAQAVNPVLIP